MNKNIKDLGEEAELSKALRKALFPDAKSYTHLSKSEILENIKRRLHTLSLFPDYYILEEDFENLSKDDLAKICYLATEANDRLVEILQISSLKEE